MPAPKSPFPGFDPYVQRFWRDGHSRLITYTAEAFSGRMPGDLRARIEERLIVETPFHDPAWRDVRPDLYVVERGNGDSWRGGAAAAETEGGVAVAEPLIYHTLTQPLRETFIEIIEPGTGGRVVTVIEFLSPTNKTPGDGMAKYLEKQEEYRGAGVSLVEIDLIRGGHHVLVLPEGAVPLEMTDWPRICVCEGWKQDYVKFYPIPLRARMPVFAVPLRQEDAPITLDLQAVFDRCFAVGEYGLDLDYRQDPKPPFSPADAAWADTLLREKGLRP